MLLSWRKFPLTDLHSAEHLCLGIGGKKMLKRYLKSEQKDGRTDTRTDISNYRNVSMNTKVAVNDTFFCNNQATYCSSIQENRNITGFMWGNVKSHQQEKTVPDMKHSL